MNKPTNDVVLRRHHSDMHGFVIGDYVYDAEHSTPEFAIKIVGINGDYKEDHIQMIDSDGRRTAWEFARNYKKRRKS